VVLSALLGLPSLLGLRLPLLNRNDLAFVDSGTPPWSGSDLTSGVLAIGNPRIPEAFALLAARRVARVVVAVTGPRVATMCGDGALRAFSPRTD
jgi:hypothetical protein